ncbi:MAG: hypothetical protein KatS3mg114_1452 [Planctomycetaceae bacterium]|nr:MAG: hypothetical protein KatS3mg114_1452 [Planctomycetaceae bacterium]
MSWHNIWLADRQQQRRDTLAVWPWQPWWWKDGLWYPFPTPIPRIRLIDTWDAEAFKIPLQSGELLLGSSRNGVQVWLWGQIASPRGEPHELLEAWNGLREALHLSHDQAPGWLFLLRDEAQQQYVALRDCRPLRLQAAFADRVTLNYELLIHADVPTLQTTLPA